MGRYLVHRIIQSILTLFLLMSFCFFLVRLFPGGPFDEDASQLSVNVLNNLKSYYGLDLPIWQQYFNFVKSAMKLQFGESIIYQGKTVLSVLNIFLPKTLLLGSCSLILAIVFGATLGFCHFLSTKKRWFEVMQITILSLPTLLLGPVVIFFLSYQLEIFPLILTNEFNSMILPILLLALKPSMSIARIFNQTLQEQSSQQWTRTLTAYGVSNTKIVFKYIVKNSLLPSLSYISNIAASILSGAVLIETLFNIQGAGKLYIESISQRDYQLILGLTIFFGFLLVAISLFVDILNSFLDPRIRKVLN